MLHDDVREFRDEHVESGSEKIDTISVTLNMPSPTARAVADVVTLAGLVRTLAEAFSRDVSKNVLDQALAKTINLNGLIASRLIDGGK